MKSLHEKLSPIYACSDMARRSHDWAHLFRSMRPSEDVWYSVCSEVDQ